MKKYYFYLLLLIPFIYMGCGKDFVEPDLTGKKVFLQTPADCTVTSQYSQTFWWDKLEGADNYRLQIVRSSFSSPQELMLDTAVVGNKYTYTLSPGAYQWRLRPENSSSYGAFTIRNLTIDSALNLSNQQVVLTLPLNNEIANTTSITFQWNSLPNATFYTLRITDVNSTIVTNTVTSFTSFTQTLSEGAYTWFVRAENSNGPSKDSEKRNLTIDITAPIVSSPVSPLDGDTVSKDTTLTWIAYTSSIGDSVFIYQDQSLTILQKQDYTTATTYTLSGLANNKDYWWHLKSVDAAGNVSGSSTKRKFRTK